MIPGCAVLVREPWPAAFPVQPLQAAQYVDVDHADHAPHLLHRSSTLLPSTAAIMHPQQSTPADSCATMGIMPASSSLAWLSMLN
jgi:hypothetical protein